MELKGWPNKESMKDMLKQAIYFFNITNEEHLIQKLINESQTCIQKEKYDDALFLLEQADLMNNWKGIYGATVLSCLAFISAKRGNFTMAEQYMNEYTKTYGDTGFDSEDIERFQFVQHSVELNKQAKLHKVSAPE